MSKSLKEDRQYFFASMYQFTPMENLPALRDGLYAFREELLGLVILAGEGINGTVAGPRKQVMAFIEYLQNDEGLHTLELKYAQALLKRMPFRKLKIKIKQEIVTLGLGDLDIPKLRGTYIEPEDWNTFIDDPELLLIDVRNVYEHRIGTFKNARNPRTLNFRQFPQSIRCILKENRPKRVAMFCTGGIRCEKASAYLKQLGVDEVYQLHGGILEYLKKIPTEKSLWNGKCFVFDGRITVNQNLEAVPEPLCKVCGQVMLQSPTSKEYLCYQCIEYPSNKSTR